MAKGLRWDILDGNIGRYGGVLGWDSFTEPFTSTARPGIEIPLFLKEYAVPFRKPKLTEISTIQRVDPLGGHDISTNVLIFGMPDVLQTTMSGWIITPISNKVWQPYDITGTPLGWGQLNFADIITYFIEGRLNRNRGGAWIRKDPDYFISPGANKYNNPIIADFQPTATTVQVKQPFTMTLYLEQ